MGDGARATSIAFWTRQTAARGRRRVPGKPWRERIEILAEAERERLPLWLPVGVAGGIAAWYALPEGHAWAGFLFAAGAVALIGLALGGGGRVARAIGLFALAAVVGCALIWWRADRM